MANNRHNLDVKLLLKNQYPIKVIIGENGSGKSTLLNYIAKQYLLDKYNVIAVANSIYDKFNIRSDRFYILGAKRGRRLAKDNILKLIKLVSTNDKNHIDTQTIISSILRTLEYLNYDNKIGIKINFKKSIVDTSSIKFILNGFEYDNNIDKNKFLNERKMIEDVISIMINLYESYGNLIWIDLKDLSSYGYYSHIIDNVFKIVEIESILKKYGIVKSIDIMLSKNMQQFNLTNASSGELNLITTMMYLGVKLQSNSNNVVIIDEPEISLHPRWQSEYITKIWDLVYLFNPTMILATHSPLIVSTNEDMVSIFTIENDSNNIIELKELNLQENKNIENVLGNMFGIITPKSHFLSQNIIKIFNDVNQNSITLDNATTQINNLLTEVKDNKQKKILNESKEMLHKFKRVNT